MRSTFLPRVSRRTLSLTAFITRLFGCNKLRRTRLRLAALDDHLLRDIGVSREDAQAEADRRGWDAPDHWHR